MDTELLKFLGMILGPTGAAWYGVKASVNGMREDIRDIKTTVSSMNTHVQDNRVDIAKITEKIRKLDQVP